jgi:hypothetical protein
VTDHQSDPEYLAGYAVHRLAEAIAEIRKLAATPEGIMFLADDFITIRAAEKELQELTQRITFNAIGWRAA